MPEDLKAGLKKPTLTRESLKAGAEKTDIQFNKELEQTSAWNAGKGSVFSAKQANVDKFQTYGSKIYGKLGYDPYKDNDKVYNDKTDWTVDISRAYTGMKKLAGVGFQDTIGLSLFADKHADKDFGDIMNNYSSTRGGHTQFWSNTMLSSGYTVGILAAIAAEEIVLGLTTAGVGNVATSVGVGLQLGNAFNKLGKLTKGVNLVDTTRDLGQVENAVQSMSSLGKVGKGGKKILNALNPIGESLHFVKNLDKMQDLNSWQKLSTGVGAVVRDARKITMTNSESQLEAKMARSEFKETQFDKWHSENPGQVMNQSDIDALNAKGDSVFEDTYKQNMALIYATNAITFDNMFKSMRFNKKMFNLPATFAVAKDKIGKVTVTAVKDQFKKTTLKTLPKAMYAAGKKKLNQVTLGSASRSVLSASGEGFQELGQDIISTAVKSYHGRNLAGEQVRGGMYDYLHTDVVNAMGEAMNSEGLSTFLSGAFMGAFSAPVGMATGFAQRHLIGGGIQNTREYFADKGKYARKQATKYQKAKLQAKELTAVFNANSNYLDHASKPIYTQSELQEEILKASEAGDIKRHNDLKEESLAHGIKTLLKNNMENEFAENLEYMGSKLNAQQMNEAFGRTDITEDNKSEHQAKIMARAKTVRNYRKVYDQIDDTFVNQHNPKQFKPGTEEYLTSYIKHKAFENLKDELLFSHGKIANKAERMQKLTEAVNKSKSLPLTEVQSLINPESLSQHIDLLSAEVSGNKGLDLSGDKLAKVEKTKEKLEALKEYQKAYTAHQAVQQSETKDPHALQESEDSFFNAYHNLLEVNGANAGLSIETRLNQNQKSFENVSDYVSLAEENKHYQKLIDTLMDPHSSGIYLDNAEKMLKDLDNNKEDHIYNALTKFRDKVETSQMLADLQEAGIFFHLNEIDELVEDGRMPTEFFDLQTNKPATAEQYQTAQKIIQAYYKKLKGKTIQKSKNINKASLKSKHDKRGSAYIMRFLGVKLNTVLDLTDDAVKTKLAIRLDNSKHMPRSEKGLMQYLMEHTNAKIKFVDNAEDAISIDEDGVISIDIRHASSDYKNSSASIENLVLSALTQARIFESLESNPELNKDAERAMKQAKEAYQKQYPNLDMDQVRVFSNVSEFLSESLNNTAFQTFLDNTVDTVSPESKSLWKSILETVMSLLKLTYNGAMIARVSNLAMRAVNPNLAVDITEETVSDEEEVKADENSIKDVEDSKGDDDNSTPLPTPSVVPESKSAVEKEIADLEKRIADLERTLESVKAEVKDTSVFRFSKVSNLNGRATVLADKINELYDKLKEKKASIEGMVELVVKPIPLEEGSESFDNEGNLIIDKYTPWASLPSEIISAFGKLVGIKKFTREAIDAVRTELINSNLAYLNVIHEYNKKVSDDARIKAERDALDKAYQEELEDEQRILDLNSQATNTNTQSIKDRVAAERARRSKEPKVKYSSRETIDRILKGSDSSIITDEEADMLVDKLKNDDTFTTSDILDFIESKQKTNSRKSSSDKRKETIARNKQITSRFQDFNDSSRFSVIINGKAKGFFFPKGVRQTILKYRPDIFTLSSDEFRMELYNLSILIKSIKAKAKTIGFKDIDSFIEMVIESNKNKELYPSMALAINRAGFDLDIPLRVVLTPIGYKLISKKIPVSIAKPKKKTLSADKLLVNGWIESENAADNDLTAKSVIASYFKNQKEFLAVLKKYRAGEESAKFDALNDKIFEDYDVFKDKSSLGSLVEEFLENETDLDEYIKDLAYEMRQQLEDYSSDYDDEADHEEAKEKELIQADLEYYNTDEGRAEAQAADEARDAYYKSTLFLIENGLWTGDVTALTQEEYYALGKAYEAGMYELDHSEDGSVVKPVTKAETDPVESNKELTSLEKVGLPFAEQIRNLDSHQAQSLLFEYIKSRNGVDFEKVLAIWDLLKVRPDSSKFSDEQRKAILDLITRKLGQGRFGTGFYVDQVVVNNNDVLKIAGLKDGKVILESEDGSNVTMTVEDLLNNSTEVLKNNTVFEKLNIDTVVKEQEIDYIKSAYQNILSNFGEYISEAEKLGSELNNAIIDQLKTCR